MPNINKLSLYITTILLVGLARVAAALAEEKLPEAMDMVDKAVKTTTTVFTIVMILIGLMVAALVGLKIWNELKTHNIPDTGKDDLSKARKFEKKGEFVLAASYFEKASDFERAIELYQRGRDFGRAGTLYEMMENPQKAMEMYKRSGDEAKVAGMHMKTGNYLEAAKLFKNQGDTLRAANAFERMGNHAAAAREYDEAGKPLKAAKLFKEAGLFKEAAESFHKSLGEKDLTQETLSQYFTLAALHVMSEDMERAQDIYERIHAIDPNFKDVARKLKIMKGGTGAAPAEPAPETPAAGTGAEAEAPAAPEPQPDIMQQDDINDLFDQIAEQQEEEEEAEGPAAMQDESSLRSLIKSGHLEPRYSLRIWMQIMKQIDGSHSSGKYFGCITPDSIFIDLENNIRIEEVREFIEVYTAPEVREGSAPDELSDVFAMGVVLYEMITGTTEAIGKKYPMDYVSDLPEWLDALIVKSMERDRSARYRGIDEVSGIVMTKATDW